MKNWYIPPEVDFSNPDVKMVYELGRRALTTPDMPSYSLLRDQAVQEFPVLSCDVVHATMDHARQDHEIYQEFNLKQR